MDDITLRAESKGRIRKEGRKVVFHPLCDWFVEKGQVPATAIYGFYSFLKISLCLTKKITASAVNMHYFKSNDNGRK